MTDNITLPRQTAQQALEKVADALPAYIDGVAAREYLAVIHKALEQQAEPDEAQQAMHDLLTTGTSVLLGGKRIDPAGMYKQAEPVAWTDENFMEIFVSQVIAKEMGAVIPLYTPPPQRNPLTDEDITKVIDSMPRGINGWMSDWDLYEFTRAIEAAHGSKEQP